MATAAKILMDEINDKGPTKELDLQLIKVRLTCCYEDVMIHGYL